MLLATNVKHFSLEVTPRLSVFHRHCPTSTKINIGCVIRPSRPINFILHRQFTQSLTKMLIPSTTSIDKPRIILGCMTFGPPGTEDKGARITSLDEYNSCLGYLQSNGYNEIDTARVYIGGQQEKFTADAKYYDKGFTIATKCYPHEAGVHKAENLKATLNKSLSELGTKCVDIFYLHAPDRSVPFEETLQACDDLFKEGKFVTLGLSNYAAWEVAEIVNIARERKLVQPKIYQAMYNAITRAIEPELVPCCRKYGIGK